MEASSLELRTTDLSSEPAAGGHSGRSRFRALIGGRSNVAEGAEAELVQALDAEVTLLREENARLRSAQEGAADPARVIARLSQLSSRQDDADLGDDAWHVLTAGLVLRDTLLEVCGEIARAMTVQEGRLRTLTADLGLEPPVSLHRTETNLPPAVSG
jgi:hypothetical protein